MKQLLTFFIWVLVSGLSGISLTAQNINPSQPRVKQIQPKNFQLQKKTDVNKTSTTQGVFRTEYQEQPVVRNQQIRPSIVKKSIADDVATITLKVTGNSDPNGFQMLLDADHAFDFETMSNEALYPISEYKIPEGASADLTNPVVVKNGEASITIPEGVYDFTFLLPVPEYETIFNTRWKENEELAMFDDYLFKAGYEYIFVIQLMDLVEFYPEVDAALTSITLPAVSASLTNSEPIQVVLSNPGTRDFSSVELSYQVNGGTPVTETYNGLLAAESEITYTFHTKADFSAQDVYYVSAWVTDANDMNPLNNEKHGVTKNPKPLDLPFSCTFAEEEDMLIYWTIIDADGDGYKWEYDSWNMDADGNFGGSVQVNAASSETNDYMVSDPINLPTAGDYHVTFQAATFGFPESFQILYGLTADPNEMTVLADYTLDNFEWAFFVNNFSVATPGAYFFAFRYFVNGMGMAMNLDNITIDEGLFVGVPNMANLSPVLPASSCEMAGNGRIGLKFTNAGTEPMATFTLTYQMNNNPVVSQTFTQPVGLNETVTVYFDQSVDFSAIGDYKVVFTATTPNEENTNDNTVTITISHFAPITALPFNSNFANAADIKDWNPNLPNGWFKAGNVNAYIPNREEYNPILLSRCIRLPEGKYNFEFTYSGGFEFDQIYADQFYIACGLSGTDPLSWAPAKEYKDVFSWDPIKDDFDFQITEAGDYVIAIIPTEVMNLAIFSTSLKVGGTGISEVDSSKASISLYPNPASEALSVNVSNQTIEKISIYTATGTTVYSKSGINDFEYKVNTGQLVPGFYFISVQTNAGVINSKFIVK
ncbi:MAG: T9SS type A sorting domain-containing protein [Candidatus Symbiothrix sp.]|nr:T9SS type A sorting domain-containing protein [Candidatus Symbiothrix sp.]